MIGKLYLCTDKNGKSLKKIKLVADNACVSTFPSCHASCQSMLACVEAKVVAHLEIVTSVVITANGIVIDGLEVNGNKSTFRSYWWCLGTGESK